MAKIKMFHLSGCPYCRQARGWMEEICSETPEYRKIDVEMIDEGIHRDLAAKYDYYLVPTYYVDEVKVHEGVATKEKIRKVYEIASEKK
jgi:glutaredoxin